MRSTLLLLTLFLIVAIHGYTVRRNVKDFGAKGDGTTDDSDAIITALTQDRSYQPSTQTPGYIYVPAGTYLVTKTLPLVYYTQLVGDPNNLPTIMFVNKGTGDIRVIEAEGGWYHDAPQNNFYHAVRNLILDMTQCMKCTGVHWQVAQATSLVNIYFKMGKGTQNQGIWMENGSGGFVSDLYFEGGKYGMWIGNQQFTSRNITISDPSSSAVYLNWDWGWTFQGLNVINAPVGIDLGAGTGSLTVIDSSFSNTKIGVRTSFVKSAMEAVAPGVNTVVLENVAIDAQSSVVVVMNDGQAALTVPGSQIVKSWVQGHIWQNNNNTIDTADISSKLPPRPAILAPNGKFFQQSRPNFASMVDVSTLGVIGDGRDVTVPLRQALLQNAGKSALFFPYGTYIISDTVYVPPGSRLVGEAWSLLMALGTAFSDASNPKPMLQVGKPNEQGVAQLMEFVISTKGPAPGAKLIEWNMKDPEGQPGACAVWDVHFRIGGAIGTDIEPGNCPSGDGGAAPASHCNGAWGLFHVTKTGSIYMENVWGWTADHDIDQHSQINVYNGRGFLCESQGPVWMYGTAMEHSVLYQYNFNNAKNVMMGMIQTETPYYQPSSLTPFNPSDPSDPQFCTNDKRCNMSLALHISGSSNIYLYGAGLYSFFDVWNQACLRDAGGPSCQLEIVKITNSHQIYTFALSTYGSVNMLTSAESYSKASANANTFCSTAAVDLNFFN